MTTNADSFEGLNGKYQKLIETDYFQWPKALQDSAPFCQHIWMAGYQYAEQCSKCQEKTRDAVRNFVMTEHLQ